MRWNSPVSSGEFTNDQNASRVQQRSPAGFFSLSSARETLDRRRGSR
jgi:hypothetical protein